MTVIACRDGIMAADTAVWQQGLIVGHTQKIHRLKDGRLLACCGYRPAIVAARAWLNGEGQIPEPAEENQFGALILGAYVERIDHKFRIYRPGDAAFSAEGSHIEFLMGAMMAGASAEEAVALIIQCGDSAGGEVQVEHL